MQISVVGTEVLDSFLLVVLISCLSLWVGVNVHLQRGGGMAAPVAAVVVVVPVAVVSKWLAAVIMVGSDIGWQANETSLMVDKDILVSTDNLDTLSSNAVVAPKSFSTTPELAGI